jgi:CHAT domain-containing protein
LLDPACSQPGTAERPVPIASFGLEFKDGVPHGLPELPGAEDEARLVASPYGVPAATGSAATETTLTKALTNARRIHIATHGLLQVSAPSFQRMFLSPDATSDGILYAYELLRYDLRGLDLLTLSACETALGRVDIGDNLRGLPANALIAGAATVVGTLWPVENSAAQTFFGSLHKDLAAGAGKREAFRTAQKLTRVRHPQFRDWGAFCYSGRW